MYRGYVLAFSHVVLVVIISKLVNTCVQKSEKGKKVIDKYLNLRALPHFPMEKKER